MKQKKELLNSKMEEVKMKSGMRKFVSIACMSIMVFSLTACGAEKPAADGSQQTSEQTPSGQQESLPVNDETMADSQEVMLFGKISEVIGNELTIQLANMPEIDEGPPTEDADKKVEEQSDMVAATALVPAQAGAAEIPAGMEIEYTGENVTINVPAGMEIRDTTGQTTSISSLEKGNVIQFSVDNMQDLNLKSMGIME